MKRLLLSLLLLSGFSNSYSQTFNGTGGAIPDDGTSVDFTISVSGLPAVMDTVNFGIESACFNILHTYDEDLDIRLIAPDGTSVVLTAGNGGGGNNFIGTCFSATATTSIVTGSAPFTGQFRPQGQLGQINNGQNPNGTWTLHILDTYPFADQGAVLSWNITFGNDPAIPFVFHSSNLPIVKINTSGLPIVDFPKITAWMEIIDNGPGVRNYVSDSANNYSGYIGIDLRGQSSLSFPQKQYGIETRDSLGENRNAAILGMPAENDWVLYAPYNDKTMMRNSLTYTLGRDLGRYASRSRYCEVIINNEYKGVYTFFEKIKRDNNRVAISGLTAVDTTGDELTGGYICSLDWIDQDGWYSNFPADPTNPMNNTIYYQYIYPQDDDILPVQKNYIQQFVDSFETALSSVNFTDPNTGWRQYGDEGSFIDYFLMNEISKNVDGYRLSAFFHKNKNSNGGKIQMGPLWDFNLAWHNADYCDNEATGGWAYLFTDYCQWDFPFWWRRLASDSTFNNNVRCRWNELRNTVFDTTHIFNYIDSIAFLLDESKDRQYFIYPILGVYVWPNPSPIHTTYQGEIANLKSWITQRIQFMDDNLPGNCLNTPLSEFSSNDLLPMYPDPATSVVSLKLNKYDVGLKPDFQITSAIGGTIKVPFEWSDKILQLNISSLPAGVYFVNGFDSKGKAIRSKFIKLN
jgi:subtilisin-like proprotein convertase family protein